MPATTEGQRASRSEKFTPSILAIHISEELLERGVSQADLARTLRISASRVSEIIRGRGRVTADFALRLGRWMGTSADLWLNLQTTYDLRVTEREHGDDTARVKPWEDATAT